MREGGECVERPEAAPVRASAPSLAMRGRAGEGAPEFGLNLAPLGNRMTTGSAKNGEDALLEGFTVLDFTRVLAGPYCTRLLSDLGARVIKVERPGEGDEVRYTAYQLEPGRPDQSSYFVRLNAGKRGIAIDLAHPQARDVVLDLVR